ncbi:MAG: alpha/beta hydrolase [Spirochaetota bacterium]
MQHPTVPIRGSQIRELHSDFTGHDYEIFVQLPEGYEGSTQTYPTLYILDGQWDFKLLDSVCGGLRYDRFVPEIILVGISYGGANPDFEALRARDYSPVDHDGNGQFGGADRFLHFLSAELVPFVEREYRADPADRAIGGHSFGGLFTFYALFHAPELFTRHISISPAIGFCQDEMFRDEEAYAAKHDDLPVRVFAAMGSLENKQHMIDPMVEMVRRLQERGYPSLHVDSLIVAGERHSGLKPEAYNRGLRAVFERPAATLSAEELDAVVGTYRWDEEDTDVVVERREKRLVCYTTKEPDDVDEIVPYSSTEFRLASAPCDMAIEESSNGSATRLRFSAPDGDSIMKRVGGSSA